MKHCWCVWVLSKTKHASDTCLVNHSDFIEFTSVCLMQITVRESFTLLRLHVSYLDSDCITADNTCMRLCRGAAAPPLPAVADLPAEHSDLHMAEEEREGGGGGGYGVRFVLLLPERLAPQAACLEMASLQPLLLLYLHRPPPRFSFISGVPRALWASVRAKCQHSAGPPPTSPSFPYLCVCVRERETERVGGFLWFPLFIQAGEGRGVVGACCVLVLTVFAIGWCVCVCVCVYVCENGPAIVLSDCWNAAEWWLCQPRCPAVLSVFVILICVQSIFCSSSVRAPGLTINLPPCSARLLRTTLSACRQRANSVETSIWKTNKIDSALFWRRISRCCISLPSINHVVLNH